MPTIFNIHQIAALPVTSKQIAAVTQRHPVLSHVVRHLKNGWPTAKPNAVLLPFWSRRHELSMEQGCILWGIRVVIPPSLQPQVLEELHHKGSYSDIHGSSSQFYCNVSMILWSPSSGKKTKK